MTAQQITALWYNYLNLEDSISGTAALLRKQEAQQEEVALAYAAEVHGAKEGAIVRATKFYSSKIKPGDELRITIIKPRADIRLRPWVKAQYRVKRRANGLGGWSKPALDVFDYWEPICPTIGEGEA